MSTIASRSVRTVIAAGVALTLAACAAAGPVESESAAAPGPSSPQTEAPTSSDPAATPDGTTFESQDGAVRLVLPEGWSVDDRSAMGEASEMFDRGPGWLNELVVLDEDGDAMLWYREAYGTDFFECVMDDAVVEQAVDPLTAGLRAELEAEAAAAGQPVPELQIRGDVHEGPPAAGGQDGAAVSTWVATLDLASHVWSDGEDCGWGEEVWAGSRIVSVGAVGDEMVEAAAASVAFGSEQAALDWFASEEAATLIEVLASIELTGAPVLDAAP